MRRLFILLAMMILLTVGGCSDGWDEFFSDSNCNDEIGEYVAAYGEPEEISKYDSGSYHSWSYSWYCKGIIVTFTWGRNGCGVSTYTFTPICY